MDDSRCRQFFLEPGQTLHRRYEVLRAFFLGGLSYQAITTRFGMSYHTVRSLVRDFRAQCRSASVPPFSPSRAGGGLPERPRPRRRRARKLPRRPTAAA